MGPRKRNARLVGSLIVVGYLTYGIPSGVLVQPLLQASDPLAAIAARPTSLTTGAALMAVNSAAVVGIGLFMYPILRRHSESIALGYVVTRTFEAIVMIGGIIGLLLLVPLSQAYVQASAADAASFEVLGTLAVHGNDYAYNVAMIGLSIGSLPFCYLLYRSELVPRAIPVLGLLGYPALLLLMVVELLGLGGGPLLYALYVPGAAFEIGLALWLVTRGYDPNATAGDQRQVAGS